MTKLENNFTIRQYKPITQSGPNVIDPMKGIPVWLKAMRKNYGPRAFKFEVRVSCYAIVIVHLANPIPTLNDE